MPHIAFAPFTGLRIREQEMLQLGMALPGLRKRAEALSGLPSLGLTTLAGLTPESWSCSYHPSAESQTLVKDILRTGPDLVAVSALTASVLEAYELCDTLRAKGVNTVIGGLHATALPEEAVSHATSVCIGDGESTWHSVLADAESGTLQQFYRPTTPFDLSNSPLPRFDLPGSRPPQRWTLQTQCGCPWACEFCGASRLLGPPRFKPVERIRRELDAILRLDNSPWLELADDNTFAARKDSLELLRTLEQANVRYFTESDWRIGEDPELIAALARSGCVQVLVGVESLSHDYQGMGKKETDVERIRSAVEAIQAAGIVVNGCFILGADGETTETLVRLAAFINQSPFAEIQLTLQTPFPGTGLYRRLKSSGRLIADRDWSYYTLFDVVYEPDPMSVEELEIGFRQVMSEVFSESAAAKRDSTRRDVWQRNPVLGNRTRNSG